MIKRILIALLILSFLGGLGYSYLHFKKKKQPVSQTINAIPATAAFIIERFNSVATWKKLSESNIIWSELQSTEYFKELNDAVEHLDSLRKNNQELDQLIKKQSIFISAHMSGAHNFDFLYAVAIPNHYTTEQIETFITSNAAIKVLSTKEYDNAVINQAELKGNKFNYTFHNGILLFCRSAILIEDAVRQLNSGTSLLESPDFKQISNTAGKSMDANFYINYKVLPSIVSTYFNNDVADNINALNDIANWAEIDLTLKPNSFSFNGFTYSNDSTNNYMNIFKDQKPQKIELLNILPTNTSFIFELGISDFAKFQKGYKTYLEKNNKLFEFGAKLKLLESTYGFSAQNDFYNWFDNELALIYTESKNENLGSNSFAFLKSNNIDYTQERLQALVTLVNAKSEQSADSAVYNDHIIKKIAIPKLLSTIINSAFAPIKDNYYTIIDDYVVFGNSISSLRDLINYVEQDKVLTKDPDFVNFYSNIETQTNIFIYSNISRSTELYKSLLNEEYSGYITQHDELYKKFNGIAIQVSKEKNNLYYNNITLNYNPVYKQETSTLWEAQLDTVTSSKPQIVINHNTGSKDIFVQDDANTIYLISNTGKTLWKKKLSSKILGDVHQIDIYKNGKLQLLFNTKNKIYLLDRNGNNVESYPVKLKDAATNPITVLDYDNNKNYRILIATKTGEVLNYDAYGNLVKGWSFKKSAAPINLPFKLVQIGKKDYVVAVDNENTVYVVDRKGETRLKLKNKLPHLNDFEIMERKSIGESYLLSCDSNAVIYKLYFADSINTSNSVTSMKPTYSLFKDMDADRSIDYILGNAENLNIYTQDFSKMGSIEFDQSTTLQPCIYQFSDNKVNIGYTSTTNNELFLVDNKGYNNSGFPLFGSTQFSIADINNDNTLELIVGGNNGYVFAYTLEK